MRVGLQFNLFVVSYPAMEESFSTRPLVGRWIALDVRPTRPLTWLGPAWSTICGALASGGLSMRGQSFLLFILSLLLCDAVMGAWRALWLQSDWQATLRRRPVESPLWYGAEFGGRGLGNRLRRLSGRLRYLRVVVWPLIDSDIVGMFIIGALAVGIAVVIGQVAIILTGGAMALALIEAGIGTSRGGALRAVTEIAIPWLIAETALGYFSWLSLVFIALFAISYRALLALATKRNDRWIFWSNAAQVVVVLLLVASYTPAGVGVALLALLAQVLWQARYRSDRDGQAYARHVQSYVLVSMLVAALSLWF
jgi:hypothetical protein